MIGTPGVSLLVLAIALPLGATLIAFVLGGHAAARIARASLWLWLALAVAIAAILHYWWHKAGKNDFSEVGWYVAVVITLLGWRLVDRWRRRVVPRVSA
jgi:sulfoxide reductase heme-binding subunit YedZ